MDLEILYCKPELLAALWAVPPVTLNSLTRRLQLDPCIESFAALGTNYSLGTQEPAKTSLSVRSRNGY